MWEGLDEIYISSWRQKNGTEKTTTTIEEEGVPQKRTCLHTLLLLLLLYFCVVLLCLKIEWMNEWRQKWKERKKQAKWIFFLSLFLGGTLHHFCTVILFFFASEDIAYFSSTHFLKPKKAHKKIEREITLSSFFWPAYACHRHGQRCHAKKRKIHASCFFLAFFWRACFCFFCSLKLLVCIYFSFTFFHILNWGKL